MTRRELFRLLGAGIAAAAAAPAIAPPAIARPILDPVPAMLTPNESVLTAVEVREILAALDGHYYKHVPVSAGERITIRLADGAIQIKGSNGYRHTLPEQVR